MSNHNTKRHRRYTIARPASAMALLSDPLDENDDQFDRISDILSNLIQEANQAVGNTDMKSTSSSIPMVRKLSSSSSSERQYHQKKRTNRIPARPVSYPSNLRRSKTPLINSMNGTKLIQSSTIRKYSSPACEQQQGSMLLESFKRLDSSLAVIDSLSRDLVPPEYIVGKYNTTMNKNSIISRKRNNSQPAAILTNKSLSFDTRLSALLLLPLLHVPHALISMAFDCISSPDGNDIPTDPSSSLGGMFLWAFIFAITNLMVDKAVILTPTSLLSSIREPYTDMENTLIPGSFLQPSDDRRSRRKGPNNNARALSYNASPSSHQRYLLQPSAMRMHDRPCMISCTHPLDNPHILARRNSL